MQKGQIYKSNLYYMTSNKRQELYMNTSSFVTFYHKQYLDNLIISGEKKKIKSSKCFYSAI